MELRQSFRQNLSIRQELVQELLILERLNLGHFEKQILEKISFSDEIDEEIEGIESTEESEHIRILQALVMRESMESMSLLGTMAKEAGITEEDIQKIEVEEFEVEGLGYDIGTKRFVNKIRLTIKGGKCMWATVSMDRELYYVAESSPTYAEIEALKAAGKSKAWCLQRFLGGITMEEEEGYISVIGKEFIPGNMLINLGFELPMGGDDSSCFDSGFIDEFSNENSEIEYRIREAVSRAVGKAVGNAMRELLGVPNDSTPLNLIVYQDDDNGVFVRWCDVEGITKTQKELLGELSLIREMIGKQFLPAFEGGLQDDEYKFSMPSLVLEEKCEEELGY